MTVLADLQAALADRLTAYAAAASTHPTHSEDGRSTDHDGHRLALLKEIAELRLLIQQEGGAVTITTEILA